MIVHNVQKNFIQGHVAFVHGITYHNCSHVQHVQTEIKVQREKGNESHKKKEK